MLHRRVLVCVLGLTAAAAAATPQALPVLEFDGREFRVIDVNGTLPEPTDLGVSPTDANTAMRKGYFFTYRISNGGLTIEGLYLLGKKREDYPPVNGSEPQLACEPAPQAHVCRAATYSGLDLDVAFSGQLRVAADLVEGCNDYRTKDAPQLFTVVKDLTFRDGQLIDVLDRSRQAAVVRNSRRKNDDCRRFLGASMPPLTYAGSSRPRE